MSAMSFLRKIAKKPRYAGTDGEREAYTLISREFERLGCKVEKEETEYIKSDLYTAMRGIITLWLFLALIAASRLVHPLTTALLIVALAAFMSRVFPKLTLSLAKDKSINVIATINPQAKNRLILCGHYDSARVSSKFFQKHQKTLVNIEPFFLLAFIVYVVILFVRGTYILAVEGFSFASLLELNLRMTGVWIVIWWAYIVVFTPLVILLTYGWIATIYINKFSYGADDNASGIAVLMETAKRLQDRKLNLRVDFACFAAEEKGLFGSRKWVNKHLKELDRDRTYVFNIDCVGRGEKFFVHKGLGTIFKKHSDPTLCNIVADVCSKLKFLLEERWGGESDHAEFIEKRFRTCAISRFNSLRANVAHVILRRMFGIPLKKNVIDFHDWIHTETDNVDDIDEQKLEESVQLVVKFVEKLNQTLDQRI